MANVKISELTGATALSGAEEFPVVQSGSTVKTTVDNIDSFITPQYRVYTALLTQNGNNAPVATVLENTLYKNPYGINDLVWSYTSTGEYFGSFSSSYNQDSIVPIIGASYNTFSLNKIEPTTSGVTVKTINVMSLTASDGLLSYTPVQIKIY